VVLATRRRSDRRSPSLRDPSVRETLQDVPKGNTTVTKIPLHEHPVEPPGGRPPSNPLVYLAFGLLALAALLGFMWLLDAFGIG
jgi:hypothetical protein